MTRADPGDRDALVVEMVRRAVARLGAQRVIAAIVTDRRGRPLVVDAVAGSPAALRPDLALPAQALLARFRHADPGWVEDTTRIPDELLGDAERFAVVPLPGRGTLLVAEPAAADGADLAALAAGLALAIEAAYAVEGGRAVSEAGALQAMAEVLAGTTQLGRVLTAAARTGAQATGFDRCTVLLRQAGKGLLPAASESSEGAAPLAGWRRFADGMGLPAANEAMATGQPAFYGDPESAADLRPADWVVPQGLARVLVVPLVAWDEAVGVMIFDDGKPEAPLDRDLRTAAGLAAQAAVGVKVAGLVDGLRHSRRHAQLVLGAMAHAATQFDTAGVLAVIADAAHEVLGDAATLVVAMAGGEPGPAAARGNEAQARDLLVRLEQGPPLRDRCDGLTALYGDDLALLGELEGADVGRALVAPLRRASRELGWLITFGPSTRPYREADLRIVAALATQAALSLHTVGLLESERTSVQQLEELGRQKTGFVASVSHELRTPLTAIIGFSEILGEWLEEDRLREFIDDVRREAVVLEGIIGNLLDTSRLEAGVLHLDRVELDLPKLVAESAEVVRHTYPSRRIDVEVAPRVQQVAGDPVRVRQILVNLLENAAKYSPEGTPITVAVSNRSAGVAIQVADQGPGIPAQYRAQVFERFFRLEGVHGQPGTGIGLYLVRELTEAHGGTVEIDDGPDGGCRVEVVLPATPAIRSEPA